MTTQPPNLLQLAQQGDPRAIATLINRTLQPKGITAKVGVKADCLQVLLESLQVPDQQTCVSFIHRGIEGLQIASIKKLRVYGKQTGKETPAWTKDILLSPSTSTMPERSDLEIEIAKEQSVSEQTQADSGLAVSSISSRVVSEKPQETTMANLLFFAGMFLIFGSIILIFFNALWAFLLLILSCVVLAAWSNTPEAKAIRREQEAIRREQEAQAKCAELAAAKAAQELEKNFQQLSKDPTNTKALDFVLDVLEDLNKEKLKPLISSIILPLLKLKPLDERVRATVFLCAQKSISRPVSSTQVPSQAFYNAALDIVQQHPEQISLKQYALEVGRWHYSVTRPDGKVTIYDEQSMQNDILVRSR